MSAMRVFDMRDGNFYILPPDDSNFPLYVDMAGTDYCHDNYRIERKQAEISVIGYVLSGQGRIQLDDERFTPKAGDTFILPAGKYQEYYPISEETWAFLWFNVRGNLLPQLLEAYHLSDSHRYPGCSVERQLRKGLALAANRSNQAAQLHQSLSSIIHDIILEIAYKHKSANRAVSPVVQQIKHYLDQHIEDHVTMEQLSNHVCMTTRHINRVFKQELGTTPYNYLLERKLDSARNLLLNTNLPISAIAGKLRFADTFYFSNIFKKKTGLSPLNYRKKSGL
jgi:AraC-like DNA-binding protein